MIIAFKAKILVAPSKTGLQGTYPVKEPISLPETLVLNISFTVPPNQYPSNMTMYLVLLSIVFLLDVENFNLTPSEIMERKCSYKFGSAE